MEYHVNVSAPEETEEELDFQDLRYPNHMFSYTKNPCQIPGANTYLFCLLGQSRITRKPRAPWR